MLPWLTLSSLPVPGPAQPHPGTEVVAVAAAGGGGRGGHGAGHRTSIRGTGQTELTAWSVVSATYHPASTLQSPGQVIIITASTGLFNIN